MVLHSCAFLLARVRGREEKRCDLGSRGATLPRGRASRDPDWYCCLLYGTAPLSDERRDPEHLCRTLAVRPAPHLPLVALRATPYVVRVRLLVAAGSDSLSFRNAMLDSRVQFALRSVESIGTLHVAGTPS